MLRLMLVTVVASYTMDDDLLGECQVGVGADMSVGRKMHPPIAVCTNHRVDEDISTRRYSRDCVANRIAATIKLSEVNICPEHLYHQLSTTLSTIPRPLYQFPPPLASLNVQAMPRYES